MSYPLPTKIMGKIPKFKENLVKKITIWKSKTWKNAKTKEEKQKALAILSRIIHQIHNKDDPKVKFNCQYSRYDPEKSTIYLKDESIITLLHEVGHSIFGNSELTSCRFSIWLFKKTFPSDFSKLKWKGHTLTKN